MRTWLIVSAAFLVGVAFFASPTTADDDKQKKLFEEKCVICHELERSLESKKSRADWGATVKRMQDYASGLIEDDEAAAIVEYLVRNCGVGE